MALSFSIKPIAEVDRPWIKHFLTNQWGSPLVVSRGFVHDADLLPGFIAYYLEDFRECEKAAPIGLITYYIKGKSCEIVTLNSLSEGVGIGSELIKAVEAAARRSGCTRLWLITTNDNLPALKFYQKRGFTLAALYPDAIQKSRLLKPEIPLIGMGNIPLRDEIELEKMLKEDQATQVESRPGVSSPSGKPS